MSLHAMTQNIRAFLADSVCLRGVYNVVET